MTARAALHGSWGVALWLGAGALSELALFTRHRHRDKLTRSLASLAHCLLWAASPRPPLAASAVYYAGDVLHMAVRGGAWPSMVLHHCLALLLLRHTHALPGHDPFRRAVEAIFWYAEMSNLPGCLAYMSLKLRGREHPCTQKALGAQLALYPYFRVFRITGAIASSPALFACPAHLWPCWAIWPMGLWWSAKLCLDLNR